jgi:hypothetical protein
MVWSGRTSASTRSEAATFPDPPLFWRFGLTATSAVAHPLHSLTIGTIASLAVWAGLVVLLVRWTTTAAVDDGPVGWSVMRRFIEFDSVMVGRDVVIEDAKTLLCDHYGISRGEAFAILRSASSHSNRKLRDVAERVVTASAGR